MTISPDRLALIRQGQRYTKEEDAAIKAAYPSAREKRTNGYFVNEADAEALNQEVFAILSVPRQSFQMRGRGRFDVTYAGTSPNVTLTVPRFGLEDGKTGILSRRARDLATNEYDVVIYI